MDNILFGKVDEYISRLVTREDPALLAVDDSIKEAGMPQISVSPNQGKFLQVMAKLVNAKKILEIGTLAGYSTIWLARGLSKGGSLISLEFEAKHADVASRLAVDDVLVDSMRGRSSTWTRIRVNLRHVPEALRPPQETPDPDDDPTREWRTLRASKKQT